MAKNKQSYISSVKYDYARDSYYLGSHINRIIKHLNKNGKYTCQDCHGDGGAIEVVIDETGEGPWYDCGWCMGTGKVTGRIRGIWLNYKKLEKQELEKRKQNVRNAKAT